MREGVLLVQRFDAVKQQLTGEPLAVAGQVGDNPATPRGMFSVSRSNVLVYRPSPAAELAWYDRTGRRLGAIDSAGGFHQNMSLSPDGERLAISRFDPDTRTRNIWVIDLSSGTPSRVTFRRSWDLSPVWSPDGTRIAFASQREGHWKIYQKASTGAGEEGLLVDLSESHPDGASAALSNWSRDGRFMLYAPRGDLWVFSVDDGKGRPFLQTEFRERQGRFSPDGRWVTYVSDESGRHEVYVKPFPHGEDKWQISTTGGVEPTWRSDGKEIFYLAADRKLMAVPVTSDTTFRAGAPTTLFETRADASGNVGIVGSSQYAVTPDGHRFLVSQPASGESAPVVVIINWAAALSPR